MIIRRGYVQGLLGTRSFYKVPQYLSRERGIDGYEAEFLYGARDTLGKALVDYLFVSTHSHALHQRITSELVGFG